MKKHIQNKDDWYYEFKPYLILSLGLVGLALRSFLKISGHYNSIAFLSGVTLVGAGYYILKMRNEHRKKSIMTM